MYRCPKCRSTNLDVSISTRTKLEQDEEGNFGTVTDEDCFQDHEWGPESLMLCRDCDHRDIADQFDEEQITGAKS